MVRERLSLRLVVRCGALVCFALAAGAPHAFAQDDRADIRYETVSPQSVGLTATYRLGFRRYPADDGSLIVGGRDEYVESSELQSVDDPGVVRRLRRGDVITHVDGVRIDSFEAYDRAMHGTGGRPRLRIVEAQTGETADWTIDAFRMLTPLENIPGPDHAPHDDGIVRAILVAPTDDEIVGAAAGKSLARMRAALEAALPPDRLEIVTLTGAACDAKGILRQIESTVCRDRDTMFIYVAARAGFDDRYAIDEQAPPIHGLALPDGSVPDDGQFLRLREGDLLRRSIWETMTLRNPRLIVLVTETATGDSVVNLESAKSLDDGSSEIAPAESVESRDAASAAAPDGWALRLLGTTGKIDVRVASPGSSGWFDAARGGWFAESLIDAAEDLDRERESDWETLLNAATQRANERYQVRRAALLPSGDGLSATARARLQAQTTLQPDVRLFDVRQDETLDRLPAAVP